MSIRKITNQQFSEGTTVDGDRLDAALQNTEDRINHVPPGDVGTRYTQTQVVAGWTALQTVANKNQAPWLRFQNSGSDRRGVGTIAHPFRVKGTTTELYGAAWTAPGNSTIWVWTTSMYFESPCVVDAIDMMWSTYALSYATNVNPQLSFGSPGSGFRTGGIQCTISVADPQATEQPIRNSLAVQLRKVYMGAETMGTDSAVYAAGVDDMLPTSIAPQNPLDLWFQRKNMQVHIPANSRVSFVVALDGTQGAVAPLDPQSYMRGAPNLVVTLLEPVEQ